MNDFLLLFLQFLLNSNSFLQHPRNCRVGHYHKDLVENNKKRREKWRSKFSYLMPKDNYSRRNRNLNFCWLYIYIYIYFLYFIFSFKKSWTFLRFSHLTWFLNIFHWNQGVHWTIYKVGKSAKRFRNNHHQCSTVKS